jgi:hypothetical protein
VRDRPITSNVRVFTFWWLDSDYIAEIAVSKGSPCRVRPIFAGQYSSQIIKTVNAAFMSASRRKNATARASNRDESEDVSSTTPPSSRDEVGTQPGATDSGAHPFQSQYSQFPPHQHHVQQDPYASQPMHGQPGAYNMAQMSAALPEYQAHHPQSYGRQESHAGQRSMAGHPSPGAVYQLPQNMPYPVGASYSPQPVYGNYPQPPYAHGYAHPPPSPHTGYPPYSPGRAPPGGFQPNPQYGQAPVAYYYYTDAYGRPAMSPTGYNVQGGHTGFPPQPSIPTDSGFGHTQHASTDGALDRSRELPGTAFLFASLPAVADKRSIAVSRHNDQSSAGVPRGPPRKPKQSGHALWVGNLPPSATIISLKEHFSKDFTREIESLFLISKSNCAFVNYRTEEACARAMQRFHDARFEGVRLVCRLRKGSVAAPGVPTGPAAMVGSPLVSSSDSKSPVPEDDADEEKLVDGFAEVTTSETKSSSSKALERYFIVKSLTLQDLQESVRTKVWATQTHNEEALNKAYKVNIYLDRTLNRKLTRLKDSRSCISSVLRQ